MKPKYFGKKHRARSRSIWLLIILLVISIMTNSMFGRAIEYQVSTDSHYFYECKFSTYAIDDPKNTQFDNPVNITTIKIDVLEANVGQNAEKTMAWGTITTDLWIKPLGDDWSRYEHGFIYIINSSNIETVGQIGFEDGKVSEQQIKDFFTEGPFIIPAPSSITDDTTWNTIKARIEGNLMAAYNYADTYIATRDGATFTIDGLGINKDMTLTINYDNQGILESYNLVNTNNQTHVVMQINRLLPDITVVQQETDWTSTAKQLALVIVPIVIVIGVIIFITKNKAE